MSSIFDEIINRRNTNSFKWDSFKDPADMIPMPIADMDFRCPPAVLQALQQVTDHGVMGYSFVPDELKELFRTRLKERYGWDTAIEWQVWIPGIVPALTAISKVVETAFDAAEIMSATPVYRPIIAAPEWVGATSIRIPMQQVGERWTFDFAALEAAITPQTKMLMLCNPHNPLGTVFNREELTQFASLCQQHDLLICSDEIHCDLLLEPSLQHIPIASLSKEIEARTFTLMAPSKTFNIAGLGCSVAIIPNPTLRAQFMKAKTGFFSELSPYAIAGGWAAYRDGEDWRQELVQYLKANHDYLYERINQIKGLSMHRHEATYLAWIKHESPDFVEQLLHQGVRVIEGGVFEGEGYFRLNFGCPRALLAEAINRMEKVATFTE